MCTEAFEPQAAAHRVLSAPLQRPDRRLFNAKVLLSFYPPPLPPAPLTVNVIPLWSKKCAKLLGKLSAFVAEGIGPIGMFVQENQQDLKELGRLVAPVGQATSAAAVALRSHSPAVHWRLKLVFVTFGHFSVFKTKFFKNRFSEL